MKLFRRHKDDEHGVGRTELTYSIALDSCALSAAKSEGMELIQGLHGDPQNAHILQSVFVRAAMIRFYSKIGEMDAARKAFDDAMEHADGRKNDVYCRIYSAMMDGLAANGNTLEVLSVFDRLNEQRQRKQTRIPVWIYSIAINACSYKPGLLNEAEAIFQQYRADNDVEERVNARILSSIINCYSINNRLQEAEQLMLEVKL